MSGLGGFRHLDGAPANPALLDRMLAVIPHRGAGIETWISGSLALGQRHDESARTATGPRSFQVAWTGTIFNAVELRDELTAKGRVFAGRSDAELVRQAYEEWGPSCVERLNGGFAFVLWDERARCLVAARDQVGLKPLVYARQDGLFAFASEPKMLFELPAIPRRANEGLVGEYLAGRHNVTEETFYAGVMRLPAGHYLTLDASGALAITRYWDLDPARRTRLPAAGDYAAAFLDLLRQSVKRRVRDEPAVGIALSGGLDSPGILYLAEQMVGEFPGGPQELETYSLVYSDRYADERDAIEAILAPSRARGHFFTVDTQLDFADLGTMIRHLDEPALSLGTIVWWYTKRWAHQNGARVLLTGHGADELLAGTNLHFFADLLVRGRWTELVREINGYARHDYYHYHRSRQGLFWEYGVKPVVPAGWRHRLKEFRGRQVPPWIDSDFARRTGLAGRLQQTMPRRERSYFDQAIYEAFIRTFTPMVLHYDEACSSAFGFESRAPYLDLPLVEFVCSVPRERKVKEGITKLIQREAFKDVLPAPVMKKLDKTLIPTVVDHWLRDTHQREIDEICRSTSFRSRGCFNLPHLNGILEQYRRGDDSADLQWVALNPLRRPLWRAVSLELWFRECVDAR